jgi:DNA-binding phage protein
MNYRTYSFRGKDPVLKLLHDAIAVSGMTWGEVAEASGVNIGTLYAWFHGATISPRFATLQAVAIAIHRELRLADTKVIKLQRAA